MIKIASDCTQESLAKHSKFRHEVLKDRLYRSESESDVRQAFLSLYDLDLVGNLEKYRIDYVHPEVWLEVKYDVNMSDRKVRTRIISQILHYIHQAPAKRGEYLLPDTFGIVDKSYLLLYKTRDFLQYIINPEYFQSIKNPSSPHPELEKRLFSDPNIKTQRFHVLADYEKIWTEFEKRGVYASELPQ